MLKILLCSNDPIFIKNVCGVVLEEGFQPVFASHPAEAVSQSLNGKFCAAILDSGAVGMSAESAARIISMTNEDVTVVVVGQSAPNVNWITVAKPLDLLDLKQALCTIHKLIPQERRR